MVGGKVHIRQCMAAEETLKRHWQCRFYNPFSQSWVSQWRFYNPLEAVG